MMKTVQKPTDVPDGLHYVIILYERSTRYEPAWHERDRGVGTTYEVTVANHMVTTNKAEWEKELLRLEQKSEKYVAFRVDKLAKVTLNVSVGVE